MKRSKTRDSTYFAGGDSRESIAAERSGSPDRYAGEFTISRSAGPPAGRASEHGDTQREREAEAAIDGRSGLNGSMNGRQGEAAAARPSRGAPPGFS